jgi:SAM-dependent methyltransferase
MPETINVAQELAEIRARIEARLSRTVPEIPELALPPLEPLREARGVVEGWSGAVGGVNFRPPGLLNSMIQAGKKIVARGLRWFTFPQSQFNSGAVAALVRVEEMFADVNRNMVVIGQNLVDRQRSEAEAHRRIDALPPRIDELLRRIEEMEAATPAIMGLLQRQIESVEERVIRLESDIRASLTAASESTSASLAEISRSVNLALEETHGRVNRALDEVHADIGRVEGRINEVQDRFWSDFGRYRHELDAEVRLVRQRLLTVSAATPVQPAAGTAAALQTAAPPAFDYLHFEERFRGPEAAVNQRQRFYLPILKDSAPVLDVACGRGEMLDLLREQGIAARGVDLDPDMVERCKAKNLDVERADALAYLEAQAPESLGAIFSAQFIEHLPISAYARLIELAFSCLRPGGKLILETQNPECLAIFSQSFYLDPTHVRPVPAAQVRFLMEEAGFLDINVHYLSTAADSGLPELPKHPDDSSFQDWNAAAERFNETYFRFLDYGVVASKPGQPGQEPGPR